MTTLNNMKSIGSIASYKGKECVVLGGLNDRYTLKVINNGNMIEVYENVIASDITVIKENIMLDFYLNKINEMESEIVKLSDKIDSMEVFSNRDYDRMSPDQIDSLGYYYDQVCEGEGLTKLENELERFLLLIADKYEKSYNIDCAV